MALGMADATIPAADALDLGALLAYAEQGIASRVLAKAGGGNVSLFAFYTLAYARSNTDGSGSSPANPYDLAADYSRAAIDTRHRFVLGGSVVVESVFKGILNGLKIFESEQQRDAQHDR